MRKRERENPCGVCGHYHKYEEGEVCGVCGHRMPAVSERTSIQVSAFPSEILPEFLYLGSYDNASRSELLKTQEREPAKEIEEKRKREPTQPGKPEIELEFIWVAGSSLKKIAQLVIVKRSYVWVTKHLGCWVCGGGGGYRREREGNEATGEGGCGREMEGRQWNFCVPHTWNNPFQGGRRDAKTPNFCPVEQRVPPIFGVPNAGRNASSRSVPSRPTYQTHP